MTEPQRAADALGDALLAVEDEAVQRALGPLLAELDRLARQASAAAAVSPDAWRVLLQRLVAILEPREWTSQAAVSGAVEQAWALALQSVADQLAMPDPLDLPLAMSPLDVQRLVREQVAGVRAALRSNDDIPAAIAVARHTVVRVKRAASVGVVQAAAGAVDSSARELGLMRRWVAERDACVHCLAYQGEVAAAGAPFAAGRTFGDRPQRTDPIDGPPYHIHCRCIVQVHDPADAMVVRALKREARRSVAKGWSLPSESEQVRLRAADRLLAAGAGLPQSVEDQARRAVRRGEFVSRSVPTGR